jgi:hypothetical protein
MLVGRRFVPSRRLNNARIRVDTADSPEMMTTMPDPRAAGVSGAAHGRNSDTEDPALVAPATASRGLRQQGNSHGRRCRTARVAGQSV